jgi:hypothetical protein
MNTTQPTLTARLFAVMLVVLTIGFSTLAMQTPIQTANPVTLKRIQTDRTATFYADHRPSCAWFVEAVLSTDEKVAVQHPSCAWFVEAVLPTDEKVAVQHPSCAWFVEAVLPTGETKLMTQNLESVAATL